MRRIEMARFALKHGPDMLRNTKFISNPVPRHGTGSQAVNERHRKDRQSLLTLLDNHRQLDFDDGPKVQMPKGPAPPVPVRRTSLTRSSEMRFQVSYTS